MDLCISQHLLLICIITFVVYYVCTRSVFVSFRFHYQTPAHILHSRYFVYLLKYFMTSISNVQSAINPKMKTKMKILVRSLTWCCTRIRTHHRINEKMFIFVCHCNRGVVKARRNATRNHHHHHYHFIMSSDLSSLVSLDRYFKLKV